MSPPAQSDAPGTTGGGAPPFSIEFGKMLCMGCRPSGRCRFGLVLGRGPDGSVVGTARFAPEHEGAGGVVHGGSVMGALDEACGAVSIAAEVLSVTAEMDVRFRRPVPLLRDLDVRAWPESRNDQGHWIIRAEILLPGDDRPLCHARARFVERDPEKHYGRFHAWLDGREGVVGGAGGSGRIS